MKLPILAPLIAAAPLTLGLAGCGGTGSTNEESGRAGESGGVAPSRASVRPSRSPKGNCRTRTWR